MRDNLTKNDSAARTRLRGKGKGFYRPGELADAILALLEFMECVSNDPLPEPSRRCRTGLTCVARFRGKPRANVEDPITGWLAEFFPNAEAQVRDFSSSVIPDIIFAFDRDSRGDVVFVVLEAKCVWQRWITDGLRPYSGVSTDSLGRSTGNYCRKCISLVVEDRDKVLRSYTDQRDRIMLLVLVFQRPGEVDRRVVDAIGPGWSVRSRHIVDRCNPADDNIGVTAMIFWPQA